MLNARVWLVTGAHRRDHITPVLSQLLWLPENRLHVRGACLQIIAWSCSS